MKTIDDMFPTKKIKVGGRIINVKVDENKGIYYEIDENGNLTGKKFKKNPPKTSKEEEKQTPEKEASACQKETPEVLQKQEIFYEQEYVTTNTLKENSFIEKEELSTNETITEEQTDDTANVGEEQRENTTVEPKEEAVDYSGAIMALEKLYTEIDDLAKEEHIINFADVKDNIYDTLFAKLDESPELSEKMSHPNKSLQECWEFIKKNISLLAALYYFQDNKNEEMVAVKKEEIVDLSDSDKQNISGATEKLTKEKENEKNPSADMIINYLLERIKESPSLAKDILQSHKTWKKCYDYILQNAKKISSSGCVQVDDNVVYEWAEDYYRKDDKAEEEEKERKREEEAKKREEEAKKREEERKRKKQEEEQKIGVQISMGI